MCGIFGTYNMKISEDIVSNCVDRISHRGPDDKGIWSDGICNLAHRRLSILDLSTAGKQPMSTIDGRFNIIYNGEIYNFIEIRNELEERGYQFKSETDTEVILYAYAEWKEGCLNKFNGMWAFAIYDREEEKIFVARDRFGIKPLFYSAISDGMVFASEMKAIMPLLPKATPNYALLKDKNKYYNYEATEECLICEIKRLGAGCYAYIDETGMEITRWWNTLEHISELPKNYVEQVELFRELFLDACKIRMRSDVTIGTALSGGLDSSATICAMAEVVRRGSGIRINRDFQHAFVAAFPKTSYDETYYAKIVTDFLNIESTEVVIDPEKAINEMSQYIYEFEEVYSTSPAPMVQLYRSLRENGVVVTLDGHGADELFGGYTGDILYALLDEKSNIRESKEILDVYFNTENVENRSYFKQYAEFVGKHYAKKILGVPTWDRLIDIDNQELFKQMGHLERTLYNSTHTTILPTLLRNYDRYSMASGIEIRMPFMDYRIVQFAFSIPWKSKLRNGYSKCIIRDALRDIMPKEVVNRKSKIGFSTPTAEWFKGPWREWICDILASQSFKESRIVDAKSITRHVEHIMKSSNLKSADKEAEQVWMMIMPYLWEEYFYNRDWKEKVSF